MMLRRSLWALGVLLVAVHTVEAANTTEGAWRDSFTNLTGFETNKQGAIQHPSGFTVSPDTFTWSQPAGESGFGENFSSPQADVEPTLKILGLGSQAERLTLWNRRYDPGGVWQHESEYYTDDPATPTGPVNNGIVFPEEISHAPFAGSGFLPAVGWGTWPLSPAGSCVCRRHFNEFDPGMGAPMTPAIGSWHQKSILHGPKTQELVPGHGYSLTFLVAADLGTDHFAHSDVPYLSFEFRETKSKQSFSSVQITEADFIFGDALFATSAAASAASPTPVEFRRLTPVTISLNPVPALPNAEWSFRVLSLVAPRDPATLAGHSHCTVVGPAYVTADRGKYSSPVLDTLSDKTKWVEVSWKAMQNTGYQDSSGQCTRVEPGTNTLEADSEASVVPCGSPLTPIRLTYKVKKAGSSWETGVVAHGGETIPGLIGRDMVDQVAAPMQDAAGSTLTGRYFQYDLELLGRSAAVALDPDLAPANEINPDSADPYPDHIYFGALRPVVEEISVRYEACAAQAVSNSIAPASLRKWGQISYEKEIPSPGCRIEVEVLAEDGSVLVSDAGSGVSLAGIDPFRNSSIRLRVSLFSDPADCDKRPVLLSWGVTWEKQPGLVELDCNSIRPGQGKNCPIRVAVPKAGPVRVAVYDVAGQLIAVLFDGESPARALNLTWGGRNEKGGIVSAGVYLVSVIGPDGRREAKRLTVLR